MKREISYELYIMVTMNQTLLLFGTLFSDFYIQFIERAFTMYSSALLLAIFMKGYSCRLTAKLECLTPVTYLSQQRYDTLNCQRYGYNVNNKLSGVA